METFKIPTEEEFRKWIKEALLEYFEGASSTPILTLPPGEENFINRKEVAGIFKISLVTLHDWMNKGLPCHKHRGRVYFIRSEVMDYVKNSRKRSFR